MKQRNLGSNPSAPTTEFNMTTCTCDKEMIEDAKRRAVRRIAPYQCDTEGNKLFYVDSFGYRGPFPGECQECYDAMCLARFAVQLNGHAVDCKVTLKREEILEEYKRKSGREVRDEAWKDCECY